MDDMDIVITEKIDGEFIKIRGHYRVDSQLAIPKDYKNRKDVIKLYRKRVKQEILYQLYENLYVELKGIHEAFKKAKRNG